MIEKVLCDGQVYELNLEGEAADLVRLLSPRVEEDRINMHFGANPSIVHKVLHHSLKEMKLIAEERYSLSPRQVNRISAAVDDLRREVIPVL